MPTTGQTDITPTYPATDPRWAPICMLRRQHGAAKVCDAAYVAVAELFDVVLLTADEKLAGASGSTCSIELLR